MLEDDAEDTASVSSLSSDETIQSEQSEQDEVYRFTKFKFLRLPPGSGVKPKPRSGHRIVYYNGKIYSFGGYNPAIEQDDPEMDEVWLESKPLLKELWELNLSTGRWRKCEMTGTVPEQLASHTAVMHPLQPGLMLIYGGTGAPFGITTSNTMVTCNLDTQYFGQLSIEEAEEDQMPQPLYGQAVITDSAGLLYTVGGTSGFTYFMDVHRLDLTQKPPRWSCLYRPSGDLGEPEPRYRHELCLWAGQLLVLGGGTSFSADTFQSLPTFSLARRVWSRTSTRPDPAVTIDLSEDGFPDRRRCHSAVQQGESVWIFGGYDGQEIFGDIWQLHLPTMQWRRLPLELPVPVYFHAMTLSEEGRMVMFGGVDDIEKNTRTNQVFSCWLNIPSLKVLAWEAVCHSTPDLASLPSGLLVAEGVPRDCLDMLTSPETINQAECG